MNDAPDVIFDQHAAAEYRDVRRWYLREASAGLAVDFRAEVDRGVELSPAVHVATASTTASNSTDGCD